MGSRKIAARVLFYSAFLLVGLPFALSQVLIGTSRGPVGHPSQGFEELHFLSEGLRLRGWLLRGGQGRAAIIVVHGLGDSLESYEEVARVLKERGHHILLIDLRGHGGSEGSHTTLGGRERADVLAAIELSRERGLTGHGVILMGYSLGAVAVLRAAAGRADVRGVVVEAPFDTYRETVAHHAKLLYGLPRWFPLIPMAIAVAEWRAGFDADEVDAVAAARDVHAPLLAISDGSDPRMPEAVVRRVFDAHPGPKRLWVAPGADHLGAILNADYWPTVLGFLEANGL
jgi:alpha-beta hydrolase superfamily lysophospholipase